MPPARRNAGVNAMPADDESTPSPEATTLARRSRRRRKIAVIVGGVFLGVTILGAHVLLEYRYRMAIAHQMPCLAGALHFYHQQYGVLPPDLRAIRDSGLYGLGATRLPGSRWEGWNEHTGPDVLYLPVVDWDGKTEYVMALQPPTPISDSLRLYVLASGGRSHCATEEELAKILARDDELRAATSQPGRWSEMAWRSPPSGAR